MSQPAGNLIDGISFHWLPDTDSSARVDGR